MKTSLSINESFQDPFHDSKLSIVDVSAIEYKLTNSPTNVNNSFMIENDILFNGECFQLEKENMIMSLKTAFLGFLNSNMKELIESLGHINSILIDNLNIICKVLTFCNEKSDVQKSLVRYIMYLLKVNCLRNEGFLIILPGMALMKEKCEGIKGMLETVGLGIYGVGLDLDLVKASLREEAICFMFRVKNFEEKQSLMNILMN